MKKTLFFICTALTVLSLFSCATTSSAPDKVIEQKEENKKQEPVPTENQDTQEVKEIPTIRFKGKGVKIEAEKMFLEGLSIYKDSSASNGHAVKVASHSVAKCNVILSAGTWECLVSEQAFDTDKSELYVNISETYYKVYPSNPPLGMWELTTRSPIYLHLDQETTLNVSICADSPFQKGTGGMNIDYIQFVKTN